MKTWDVFISHASEDKLEVAVPLAEALARAGLRVWLDRQELRLGDSLHEKIDEGLAKSRFGVVILSPSFLAKRWPRKELDGLLNIEDANGRNVILPVWHQLDQAALANHSPMVAGRLAANTAVGIPAVACAIIKTVTQPGQGALVEVAPTALGLLTNLLEQDPERPRIVEFLGYHAQLVHGALGSDPKSGHWSTKLGPVEVDFCGSRTQHTTREIMWYLVQFQPPAEPLLLGSNLSPLVTASLNEIREVRRWMGGNLRAAREILPGIEIGFTGVVVAGRRQQLAEVDKDSLRRHNQEFPGVTFRTYDWIIDAATEEVLV
jgi:hypothetical protein